MERVCVIGAGYVGLVTGVCLADRGQEVVCLDIDDEKIQKLSSGHVPFYEPGLEDLLLRSLRSGHVRFTTSYAEAIPDAQYVFIAVETPAGAEGQADLLALRSAAFEMAPLIRPDTVVI